MLTKAFILVIVMLIGLALGFENARYVHSSGGASTGMVNIHHGVFTGVLLTVLWVSRAWLARQWTRFTVWFELTLDGLFDFDALNVGDGTGPVVLRGADAKWLLVSLKNHASPEEMNRRRRISRERLAKPFVELPPPSAPDYEACAQDALDDAAKTTCAGCGDRGHWSPAARPPPHS